MSERERERERERGWPSGAERRVIFSARGEAVKAGGLPINKNVWGDHGKM